MDKKVKVSIEIDEELLKLIQTREESLKYGTRINDKDELDILCSAIANGTVILEPSETHADL